MNKPKRALGFYVSLFACVMAVASAVCYGLLFKDIVYKEPVFDINICILLGAIGVIGAVLLLIGERTAGFAPAVLCLGSGVSIFMFVRMVIWPVSDTIYGIEPFPEFTQLVICAVLLVLTWIVSEVVLYMKKFHPAEIQEEGEAQ